MKLGTVFVTHDINKSSNTSDIYKGPNPYGVVYKNICVSLMQHGWEIKRVFPQSIPVNESDLSGYIEYMINNAGSKPSLVIHDNKSFTHQNYHGNNGHSGIDNELLNQIISIADLVRNELFFKFKGVVERTYGTRKTDWDNEISSKDKFYLSAINRGIPTPKTMVFNGIDLSECNYFSILNYLCRPGERSIITKLVNSSGGEGVHVIESDSDFQMFLNSNKNEPFVVQEKLINPGGMPYSIRTVSWGDKVLGAVLLMNKVDQTCSNSHKGGLAFDLALPGEKPRTGMEVYNSLKAEEKEAVKRTTEWCYIDIEKRQLPKEIYENTIKIGRIKSNALLRGNDFMYSDDGIPLAIESNMHPGPPGTGMFTDIQGMRIKSIKTETEIASRLILEAIIDEN